MASKQSEAVAKLYQSWLTIPTQDPRWSLADQRDLIEGWNVLTTEPGDVVYLEVSAGPRRAMWAVPHGATADRVLFCIHGGGFISGSIYTHRKVFGHLAKAAGVRGLLVSYRLLPEGVYPIPVDDTFAAYRWLLEQGIDANHMLDRYIAAFERSDAAALERLLRQDATLELPPSSTWFAGDKAVARAQSALGSPGDWRMLPTAANGQPAAAAYRRTPDGNYRAYAIVVLTATSTGIGRLVVFSDAGLFSRFSLPQVLPLVNR
jgi:alpha/beta hydrolase fold